jgi:hypothetical protein
MTTRTLIGFQYSSNSKVTVLELCSDIAGQLSITGKVLNSLYNDTTLAKQLIEKGTDSNDIGDTSRIDVSNIVDIDDYTWGVVGTNLGIGYIKFNTLADYLEMFSVKAWYQYIYMFSEADNKWYVASRDNQTWRSLADEL